MSAELIKIVAERSKHWTHLNLHTVEDTRLTLQAKGLHTYLISRPPGWVIHEHDLLERNRNGRDSIRACLRELEDVGYLRRDTYKKSGRFTETLFTVFEEPLPGKLATENQAPETHPPSSHQQHTPDMSTLKGTQGDPGRSPRKGPLKKYTPAGYIPPLPKKVLKVVNIPRVLEPIVDLWMEVGIPHGDTTKALRNGVRCAQQVLQGEFFSNKPGYKDVKEKFEVSDVVRALKRFDKKRNDPDYLPSNKKALKSIGLADFFYNPYFRNGNGANGCSIFIQCLDDKPKLASDKYEEFTEYIMDLHARKVGTQLNYRGASSVAKKLMAYWDEKTGWLCRQGVTTPKRLAVMWIAMLNETRGQGWDIGLILSTKMNDAFESHLRRQR